MNVNGWRTISSLAVKLQLQTSEQDNVYSTPALVLWSPRVWLGSDAGLTKITYCPSFLFHGTDEDSISWATAYNCHMSW